MNELQEPEHLEGELYCTHCGTKYPVGDYVCKTCGADLTDEIQPYTPAARSKKSLLADAILAGLSLAAGIQSFWPYFYLVRRHYYPQYRTQPFLHAAFDSACLGGFPLGILGIILGVLAVRKLPTHTAIVIIAALGILFSLGGMLGHAWFIATCQFCQ